MSARVHLFIDDAGEGRFTIIAGNNQPVAQSEGYSGGSDTERLAAAHEGFLAVARAVSEIAGQPVSAGVVLGAPELAHDGVHHRRAVTDSPQA